MDWFGTMSQFHVFHVLLFMNCQVQRKKIHFTHFGPYFLHPLSILNVQEQKKIRNYVLIPVKIETRLWLLQNLEEVKALPK